MIVGKQELDEIQEKEARIRILNIEVECIK